MRLLELSLGNGAAIDLHPYVSVVHGLDARQRALVLDTVVGLAEGKAVTSGLVEVHGVLLDLDADTLALLDIAETGADVVVRGGELPGSVQTPTGRTLRARQQTLDDIDRRLERLRHDVAVAEQSRAASAAVLERAQRAAQQVAGEPTLRLQGLDEVTRALDEEIERRRQLDERLVDARAAAGWASAELASVEEETATVRAARRRSVEETTRLLGALEEARAARDPAALGAQQAALEALDEIQRQVELERDSSARRAEAVATEDPEHRLAAIDGRIAELRGLLAILVPADPSPVEEALAHLRGDVTAEPVPSPEAYALADDLDKVEARLAEHDTGSGPADSHRVAEARGRLDAARAALVEAEQVARVPELDRDDVDALEDAHAAVLDMQERADARFGGARAKKRLDEVRAAERAVLDRLGFATYADFMMGTSILNIDPETEAMLDAARAELLAAEDDWRELQLVLDADLERGALLDRRRELRERAAKLLGGTPAGDLASALRELRVMPHQGEDAEVELRIQLDRVGIPIADEDVAGAALIDMATRWLEEDRRASQKRAEAVTELDALVAERALVAELVGARTERGAGESATDGHDDERLVAARRELADAESRVRNHLQADAHVADLEEQLRAATEREQEVAGAAAEAEERIANALAAEQAALHQLSSLELDAAEAAASERALAAELRRLEGGDAAALATVGDGVEPARDALAEAEELVSRLAAELDALERERGTVASEVASLIDEHASATGEVVPSADEVEWYLLARMAAQRSVTYAGSLPMVLDDALAALDDVEVGRLLERIERMAEAVQLIILSESHALMTWAVSAGVERAAAVTLDGAT